MKTLDINELKKHPERKLILRHYRRDMPEIWDIEEAQVTIGNQLVIKVPKTGYDTPEYVIVDDSNNEVRDTDGNLVGMVEFASGKMTLEEFANKLLHLSMDETLDFCCSDTDNDCQFGAKKIRLFDSTLIITAAYGGKHSKAHDITDDENSDELCESIRYFLQDYLEDYIYIDLCLPIEKEIDEQYHDYLNQHNEEPQWVVCTIEFLDDKSQTDVKIKLSFDVDEKVDNEFCYYCSGIEDVKNLCSAGVEDFMIIAVHSFGRNEQ